MSLHVKRQNFLGRNVAVVFGVVVALELIMATTSVQLLQIPGYLILLPYDYVQNAWLPGLDSVLFYIGFALYLYAGAVIIANLYQGFQQATRHDI